MQLYIKSELKAIRTFQKAAPVKSRTICGKAPQKSAEKAVWPRFSAL